MNFAKNKEKDDVYVPPNDDELSLDLTISNTEESSFSRSSYDPL